MPDCPESLLIWDCTSASEWESVACLARGCLNFFRESTSVNLGFTQIKEIKIEKEQNTGNQKQSKGQGIKT